MTLEIREERKRQLEIRLLENIQIKKESKKSNIKKWFE